jgi:hypothetical protein
VFHLYPNLAEFGGQLDVTCATIDGAAVEPQLEDSNWVLRLPFATPLAAGATARATLHFQATTPRHAAETKYGAFNAQDGLWTLASFYPTLAIRVDNAWDTLRPNNWGDFVNSDMSLYHARVVLPAGDELLSSGDTTSDCGVGQCRASVAAGPQRDLTLVLLRGWEHERKQVGTTTVVSSFPPNLRAGGERTLAITVDAVARYNAAFGIYPYDELDILPIPASSFAGVEYPGLIMIGSSFYTPEDTGSFTLADVVVHEVAHMWWYDVVGNDVLREPWLDEGLASYTGEYLYTEWIGARSPTLTERRRASIDRLNLGKTPIDEPVEGYQNEQAYVAVIYARAPLFFDALRHELGDEIFFKLLREYYRRNTFGRATTASFKALAEEVAGRKLDTFFAQWFRPAGS